MKCDTCKHNVLSFEAYGWEPYCNIGYWGGNPIMPDEIVDNTVWDKCNDFQCSMNNCNIHVKEDTK